MRKKTFSDLTLLFKNICIMVTCVCFFTRCSSDELKTNKFIYNIEVSDKYDSIKFSDLIDSVRYIKLETILDSNRNNCVEEIKQIVIKNDMIFINDFNSLLCFDTNGNWKYSIDKKGYAKNEFIGIESFNVDNNKICIYDRMKKKILFFDAETGTYFQNKDINFDAKKIYYHSEHLIIYTNGYPTEINPNGELYSVFSLDALSHPIYYSLTPIELLNPINQKEMIHDDGLLVYSYYLNKSWKINSNGLQQYFNIKVPSSKELTENDIEEIRNTHDRLINFEEKIYGLSFVCETNRFISGQLKYNEDCIQFMYDKKTDKTKCYKFAFDDFWFYPPYDFSISDENHFYSIIYPDIAVAICELLSKKIQEGNYTQEDLRNYNIFKDVKESDNPIIAVYHINTKTYEDN